MTPASADLILTLSDPTAPIYVGGTFTVDLFASGSNLTLSDFAVEFQIGRPGSPDTPVLPTPTFADGTMANPNPTATLGNYVFSGQSADALTPTTFGSAVADSHGQLTSFEGGDNQQNPSDPNDSFNDVTVTSTNGLLAQLDDHGPLDDPEPGSRRHLPVVPRLSRDQYHLRQLDRLADDRSFEQFLLHRPSPCTSRPAALSRSRTLFIPTLSDHARRRSPLPRLASVRECSRTKAFASLIEAITDSPRNRRF